MKQHGSDLWLSLVIPAAFVLLWSTGWIVAKFAVRDADVLTFLVLRYFGAAVILAIFAWWCGALWPRDRNGWFHAFLSGILLHALYLGGIWWAISQGVPASISALLAALQPILTACLAPRLAGEKVSSLQWTGILLGLLGILLVLAPKLASLTAAELQGSIVALSVNALGMVALTLGTFYQKRFLQKMDLRAVGSIQFAAAMLVTLPAAYVSESMHVVWSLNTILSLAWSIGALSIVSIALLLHLLRKGEVARAAQLIYLVPPTAAIQAFLYFGETLTSIQMAGMALTCLGVALAVRR